MAKPTESELQSYNSALREEELMRLAASRTPAEEQGEVFAADVSMLLDCAIREQQQLPFGATRRLAQIIGIEALRATLAISPSYKIARRPRCPKVAQRRAKAVSLTLAERFISLVFEMDKELGNRREALRAAQDEMHSHVKAFSDIEGFNPKDWAPVDHRGRERRFAKMVTMVDEQYGRLPNRTLATIPELPPVFSIKDTAAKPGRKKRQQSG